MDGSTGQPAVPRRVLVVDDHAGFRAEARMILERGPFRVVGEAVDGSSALDEVARLQPDVVLLDVALPDLDGFEVARRLRATGATPAIVLVSSRDARDYGGRVERSGARGFIPKSRLTSAALALVTG
jgi:DNA-binding NarL/FixJ family response regulator